MVKRILTLIILGCFITSLVSVPAMALTEKQRKRAYEKAVAAIQGREFVIYIKPDGGKKVTLETDALSFNGRKLTSANLLAQGYPASNCALTLNDDGSLSFETMQVQEETGNRAFFKGDIYGQHLKGVLFMKPQRGKARTFNFSTSQL